MGYELARLVGFSKKIPAFAGSQRGTIETVGPECVYGRYPTIGRFWGIRRHDDQGDLARRTQEAVPGTSV